MNRIFKVDGKPFFPLGGQTRNSSGYNHSEMKTAFEALKLIRGNTLEIPVYWEQIEPDERNFNFDNVEVLLSTARDYGVKLVILWFGTWKNGDMDYVPRWVKMDPKRFLRVRSQTGKELWNLSTSCQNNLEADQRAFCQLCSYLKMTDQQEKTVIAIQIENEPGILGADRDYGEQANRIFMDEVPEEILNRIEHSQSGRILDIWEREGKRKDCSWHMAFGNEAGEIFTAWSIASYINTIAEAGKSIYHIPMYVNVWLGEGGWRIPGEDYPSGGAVSKVLDIYKWFTPAIDLIAPDIYIPDVNGYIDTCKSYMRNDNPLFIPESAPGGTNAWNMFRAIGEHNAIGYSFFAIEHIITDIGEITPGCEMIADSFRIVKEVIPLLLKYQGTNQIHTVVQEEDVASRWIEFDGWYGMIVYDDSNSRNIFKDWRHRGDIHNPNIADDLHTKGRGFIFQISRNEFYLVGANYRLVLRPKLPEHQMFDPSVMGGFLLTRQAHVISVDEGYIDISGEFVAERRRNGDEIDSGIWVEADTGVIRVQLCE